MVSPALIANPAMVPGRSLVYVRLFPMKSTRETRGFAGVGPGVAEPPAQAARALERTNATKVRCWVSISPQANRSAANVGNQDGRDTGSSVSVPGYGFVRRALEQPDGPS